MLSKSYEKHSAKHHIRSTNTLFNLDIMLDIDICCFFFPLIYKLVTSGAKAGLLSAPVLSLVILPQLLHVLAQNLQEVVFVVAVL